MRQGRTSLAHVPNTRTQRRRHATRGRPHTGTQPWWCQGRSTHVGNLQPKQRRRTEGSRGRVQRADMVDTRLVRERAGHRLLELTKEGGPKSYDPPAVV